MANGNLNSYALFTDGPLLCPDPAATFSAGEKLGRALHAPTLISLEGPLGAGKTHFVQGVASGLDCSETPSSPSFAIVQEYPSARVPIFHFDFYRMEQDEELITCGFEDCLDAGVVLAEWGDKFPHFLPPGTLRLRFEVLPGAIRRISASLQP
jgi:tRNA threonylcarbamoyladenosine biosynthesis protein TsaE